MESLAYIALKKARFDAILAVDILHEVTGMKLESCSEEIENYFRYPLMLKEAMQEDAYSALKEANFEAMPALDKLHEITGADLPTCSEVIEDFYRDSQLLISVMQNDVVVALKAMKNDVESGIKLLHKMTGLDMQVCLEAMDYFLSKSTPSGHDLELSEEITPVDAIYTIAKCGKCDQIVPFDQRQKVCFCMYCGAAITREACIQDETDGNQEQIIGIVQNEFSLSGQGLVVTTNLETTISVGDHISFLSSNRDRMGNGEILGIENDGKLLDTAEDGMSVGLLIVPEPLYSLVGCVMVFDQ